MDLPLPYYFVLSALLYHSSTYRKHEHGLTLLCLRVGQSVQAGDAQAQQSPTYNTYNAYTAGSLPNFEANGSTARNSWNGNIRDEVKFWIPARGISTSWETKAASTTSIDDTYTIIEMRAKAQKKTSDFDKIEMMRQARIDALIAHKIQLQVDPNAKPRMTPQNWEGGIVQWNYQAKNNWTYPANNTFKTPKGAEIFQEARKLYRILSVKEAADVQKTWGKVYPNYRRDGRLVQQMPEAPLEQAYQILVDGHVDEDGKHRHRDDMSMWISTHVTNSIKRDLCNEFCRMCPTCGPKFKLRTEGHAKRTATRTAKKEKEMEMEKEMEKALGAVKSGAKRQLEDDDEASPNPAKKPKRQATMAQAQVPQQIGSNQMQEYNDVGQEWVGGSHARHINPPMDQYWRQVGAELGAERDNDFPPLQSAFNSRDTFPASAGQQFRLPANPVVSLHRQFAFQGLHGPVTQNLFSYHNQVTGYLQTSFV